MARRYLPCQLLLAVCALAQSTTQIDNDQVKAVSAHQKPHARTPMHEHGLNRVMIYLQSGKEIFRYEKGGSKTADFNAGDVEWSPAGGRHTAEIASLFPVTIVEIEVKKPGNPGASATGPLDPVKVDPKHYKIEFENRQVRVLRVKIGPHEATPVHHHALNRVVTYLTDQDFRITSADGKAERSQHKAGDVVWGGAVTHKEENLSDKPFEVVVTELKN